MTPEQYAAAIIANRLFGRLQVRQHSRKLATEYGFPEQILDPPPRRDPRDVSFFDDATAIRRDWLLGHYAAAQVMDPRSFVTVTSVA